MSDQGGVEGARLLASQRHDEIVAVVQRTGAVRIPELVSRFGVSEMTARRDIAELAAKGLVTKVHGGATAVRHRREEPDFAASQLHHRKAKEAIAAAAAGLVSPGDTVALSSGTTVYAVAQALVNASDLTVITNSLPVAEIFTQVPQSEVTTILTGGQQTAMRSLVGPVALASMRELHTDWLFLGVHGLDPDVGISTPNLLEADTARAFMAAANHVVVVADSSKWGVVALRSIASLADIDMLITDEALSDEAAAIAAQYIPEVTRVAVG